MTSQSLISLLTLCRPLESYYITFTSFITVSITVTSITITTNITVAHLHLSLTWNGMMEVDQMAGMMELNPEGFLVVVGTICSTILLQCLYYRQSTLHLAFGSFSSLQLEEQDVQVSKLCLMTLPLDPRGVALLCGLLIFNF